MPTVYCLKSEDSELDLDVERFQSILPQGISVELREGGLFATIASPAQEDEATQSVIDRELHRLFFLTNVRLFAVMCRRTVISDLTCRYRICCRIPEGTTPTIWTETKTIQVKLWCLAADETDPLVKILLLFQIIELAYPDTNDKQSYPAYTSELNAPQPRTEAKLLRHLVAHAGSARAETARYLSFLGLPAVLSNHSHPEWRKKIEARLPIVEEQARAALQSVT